MKKPKKPILQAILDAQRALHPEYFEYDEEMWKYWRKYGTLEGYWDC